MDLSTKRKKCTICYKPLDKRPRGKTGKCQPCYAAGHYNHLTLEAKLKRNKKISQHKLGHPVSESQKEKQRNSMLGRKLSKVHKQKIKDGVKKFFDSPESKEAREKISEKHRGANHYLWQGGKSYEDYGIDFNQKLKKQIKIRDAYRCQECFRHQSELLRPLSIHHIDYNKKNNSPENLITLCLSCHAKMNFRKDDWKNYYQERHEQAHLGEVYGLKY
jgi:HNH endonuclease/NUMOD3 motif